MALQRTTQLQTRRPDPPPFNQEKIKKWISDGITREAVEYAEKQGEYLVSIQMTTSQIRNVFGELRRIQMGGFEKNSTAFLLLKPKIAYAAKRAKSRGVEHFRKIFDTAHEAVKVEGDDAAKHFNNLMDFMESILAYHKSYGGREN